MTDSALVFNTNYSKIERLLKDLEDLHFDIKDYREQLISIKNDTENKIEEEGVSLGFIYQTATFILYKLEYDISSKYGFYYKMNNAIKYLEIELLSKEEIPSFRLEHLTNEVQFCLQKMENSSTIKYEAEENLFNRLYDIAYALIKKEIILTDNSNLLEYVKGSEIDNININKRISDDIDKINLDNNPEIATLVYGISKEKISPDYVDLNLIKAITNYQFKTVKTKEQEDAIVEKLKEAKNSLDESIKEINSSIDNESIKQSQRFLNSCNSQIKEIKIKIASSIISIVLSISTIAAGFFYLTPKIKLIKKHQIPVYTYTEGVDEPTVDYKYKKTLIRISPGGETIYVKEGKDISITETSPFEEIDYDGEKSFTREIKIYDLSDIELENPKDYFNLDLEELNRQSYVGIEDKTGLTPDDLYDDTIRTLTIENYTKDNDTISKAGNITLYFIAIILSQLLLTISEKNISIIRSIMNLYDEITYYLPSKVRDKKYYNKQLKEIYNKLVRLINKSEELKENFNSIYKETVPSYLETEELRNLYTEVNSYKETIELPKDYFKPKKKEKVRK